MTNSWIRVVYYYLFALVGLVLMVISLVNGINLVLKMTIFQQADLDTYSYQKQPPTPASLERQAADLENNKELNLKETDKQEIQNWLTDYRAWKEQQAKIDPIVAQRQREASNAIAMLIIGLPLFLFHFLMIRKEKIGLA